MALKMKIVSDNAAEAGKHRRWTFGVNGGSIGRNGSNDWILRDPERFISGRHVEIEHRGGRWWLLDISTNGTFVNGADDPVGPGDGHLLSDGDRIRVGRYEIAVEISGGNDFVEEDSLRISDEDLDAAFDVKSFLSTGRRESDSERRRQTRRRRESETLAEEAPEPVAAARTPPASRARDDQELWAGVVALCRGAGIDPRALAPDVRGTALNQAGQLLREMLVGLAELSRQRAEFARQLGGAGSARRRGRSAAASKSADVEPLLEMLLSGEGPDGGRAVDEIRDQFSRARGHEQAVVLAMREGLATLLSKLDPEALEQSLGRRGRGAASPDAQRLWSRYVELYRATAQPGDEGLPGAFQSAFSEAYRSASADDSPEADRD